MSKDIVGSDIPGINYIWGRLQRGELTFLVGRGAKTFALEYFGTDTTENERTLAGLHPSDVARVVKLIDRRHKTCKPGEAPTLYTTLNPLVLNELEPEQVFLLTHWGRRVTPITSTKNFADRSKVYALGELWLSYLHYTPEDSEPDLIEAETPDPSAWEEYYEASQALESGEVAP